MLKMRLPVRTAEEPGDEQHRTGSALRAASGSSSRLAYPLHLDKETVFQWFGLHLNPAKRIELMCGLLHMCQPLELRFLGSCLEDLARKDFHVLRDFETKANSPRELGLLADVGDPVVRSKLLVCLSLLGSDNRRCAGILFRTLGRVDPPAQWQKHRCRSPRCSRLPLLVADDGLLQQLALLFTMASLHPAFPFHQRENVRLQLEKVELAVREEERRRRLGADSPATEPCLGDKIPQADDFSCRTDIGQNSKRQCQHLSQSPDKKCQREAVYIEKILLKGISWSRSDKEYCFELKWSNSTSSTAIKTHHELENFLLKLPKEFATESFEKSILRLLSQGDKYECWELEQTLKEKFLSAPPAFRQTRTVSGFFLSSPGSSCSHCKSGAVGVQPRMCCVDWRWSSV